MKRRIHAFAVGLVTVGTLSAVASAASVNWEGRTWTDVGGYYGNTVAVNGSGNLEVGIGTANGWNGSLAGVAGHFFQGRTNWTPDAAFHAAPYQKITATFLMPNSTPVGTAYDSWISVRVLRYPGSAEHSGDAGFFFADSSGDGDMYYANTQVVNGIKDNPEFALPRPAAGTSHSISIERNPNGTLNYYLDGTKFHTSLLATAPTFPDLGTIQLGGGYFVAGSNGSAAPSAVFEFTNFEAVSAVPTPAALGGGLLLLSGLGLSRRRRD